MLKVKTEDGQQATASADMDLSPGELIMVIKQHVVRVKIYFRGTLIATENNKKISNSLLSL